MALSTQLCHFHYLVHEVSSFDNYGTKMAGFWTFVEGNVTCIASLSFTFLQCFGAIILAFLVGRKFPSLEKWIIAWLFYDAMTHFSLVRDAPKGPINKES